MVPFHVPMLEALCFIFSLLKSFHGNRLSTKKFLLKIFCNEINSNENFPDYIHFTVKSPLTTCTLLTR